MRIIPLEKERSGKETLGTKREVLHNNKKKGERREGRFPEILSSDSRGRKRKVSVGEEKKKGGIVERGKVSAVGQSGEKKTKKWGGAGGWEKRVHGSAGAERKSCPS